MPARTQSRITTACNSCRMRKQKCSGNRPKCIQCLDHRRTCDWPEQLKRGPAKGYIESLERRLQETESLLLGLLEQVSDPQLAESISHPSAQLRSASATVSAKRGSSSGSEHWRLFPLRSVQEVRAWQEECIRPASSTALERGSASGSIPASTPTTDRHRNREAVEQTTEIIETANIRPPAAQDLEEQRTQPQRSPEPQPSLSTWCGAPSANFQQRFLW
ncbi:hypothetical protein BDV06DRAFT_156781 [Aspergillus oleicola]